MRRAKYQPEPRKPYERTLEDVMAEWDAGLADRRAARAARRFGGGWAEQAPLQFAFESGEGKCAWCGEVCRYDPALVPWVPDSLEHKRPVCETCISAPDYHGYGVRLHGQPIGPDNPIPAGTYR